jgi:hypothetical protein
MSETRFSEEEFARVLRKATELQSRSLVRSEPGSAAEGMSLEEMKQIASEVGIDPEVMERAALSVAQERSAAERPLAEKFVLADSAPGSLSDEDKARIVQAIRDVAQMHGDAEVGRTGVEWSSPKGEPTQYHVSVHTIEGRNEVRVAVDRSVGAILSHLPPILGGSLLGVATGAILEPESILVGIGIVAAGAGTGIATARTIWRVTSRKVRERAAEILRATTAALPAPAVRSRQPDAKAEGGASSDES